MSSDGSFSDCSGGDYDDGSGGDDGWISEDGGGWISEDGDHQDSSDQQEGSEVEEGINDSRSEEEADGGEISDHGEAQEAENSSDHEGTQEDEDHGAGEEGEDHGGAEDSRDKDWENDEESLHSSNIDTEDEEEYHRNTTSGEENEYFEWSTDYCEYYQSHFPEYESNAFPDESTDDEYEEPEDRDYNYTDFFPSDEESYISLGQGQHHQGRRVSVRLPSVRNESASAVYTPERSVSVSPVFATRTIPRVVSFANFRTREVQSTAESREEEATQQAHVGAQSFGEQIIPETRLLVDRLVGVSYFPESAAEPEPEDRGDFSDLEEVEYLGAGNFGQVFKMSGLRNGKRRFFAEKRMSITDPSAQIEQEMLESVSHRHIIDYIQSYIKDNQLIVLMEFADRGTLTKMVEDASGNPSKEVLFEEHNVWRFINHMSSALNYLHISNILHRDLKVLIS